ncbi:thiamine biosynthesis protein ThiH [Candidatus Endomicrobiellum trichonymphae]|uniref:Thiamine biosynthesis protein ThiH n=1 Tax=Endomicrobium trichonymphae TaxID=1408204 RepID=A0A1E5IGG7_ENDTX|nr:thiamine biosynthesis protein ThiH [Candidatus Endomicrobium trichonymphae]
MPFYDIKQQYDTFDFENYIAGVSDKMVESSMQKEILNDMDFLNLLSPKALNHIEEMAQKAHETSVKYFGKGILLYAPLYVSNFCINNCIYCGFSTKNKIKRKVLSFEEIEENCKIVSEYGIHHILLVTGESNVKTPLSYLKKCVEILKNYFDVVDIEIYPLDESGYKELADAGADGLTIYQETYNEKLYKLLHTKGAKSDYKYRLETCKRAGRANYRNLNVGVLLGLNDFVSEIFFAGIHAKYLQRNFPSAEIGMSFPRLRPAAGAYKPKTIISDKNLIQAICAVRLFINRINITVSTRESKELRNNLIPLGITKMSAGSSTEVGGYAEKRKCSDGQFKINDTATVDEVKKMIYQKGYQPLMKDWTIL